jgi:YcxB-like protein
MAHQVALHYDEQLLRRVVLSFWWRVVGPSTIVALLVSVAGLVMLISNGDRSWVVGVMGTVVGMGAFCIVLVYVIHYRNVMHKFRTMGDPEATLVASEESFSFSSGLGSSTLRWASITEVWQFPAFWLLFFAKAQFVTIPLADITPEVKAFILARVQDAGGKIR